jgi:hypothetical protein
MNVTTSITVCCADAGRESLGAHLGPATDVPACSEQPLDFGQRERRHHAVGVDGDDHVAGCCRDTRVANDSDVPRVAVDDLRFGRSRNRRSVIGAPIRNNNDFDVAPGSSCSNSDCSERTPQQQLLVVSRGDHRNPHPSNLNLSQSVGQSSRQSRNQHVIPDQIVSARERCAGPVAGPAPLLGWIG